MPGRPAPSSRRPHAFSQSEVLYAQSYTDHPRSRPGRRMPRGRVGSGRGEELLLPKHRHRRDRPSGRQLRVQRGTELPIQRRLHVGLLSGGEGQDRGRQPRRHHRLRHRRERASVHARQLGHGRRQARRLLLGGLRLSGQLRVREVVLPRGRRDPDVRHLLRRARRGHGLRRQRAALLEAHRRELGRAGQRGDRDRSTFPRVPTGTASARGSTPS